MALSMVFVFKHEADINNLDVTLLLAMAEKESTFRSDVVSSGGSVGLMQIMPSTANAFGISRSQLFDMHTNIEFGARYIGSHLQTFGTETKALSAYNKGGGAVSRGNYSTRYATRIQGAQQTMESYLTQNGYGTGN